MGAHKAAGKGQPSRDAKYVVGIDLGTTHCAMAYSPISHVDVRLFEIPQLLAPGEVASQRLLPSFTYLPAVGELAQGERTLPWGENEPVVGEWARRHGARVPNRCVASAKSWICHGGVNRRAPILPWSAPDQDDKISPFDAQVEYLAHLRNAWNAKQNVDLLEHQEVVITVPASFDEAARELVQDAARKAGLVKIRLLEEPQAAFYDFLGAHETELSERLGDARLILVVDVGGGTTDLTLLKVLPELDAQGEPIIERIAVGGHLMLGGDNMDAALGHHIQQAAGLEGKLDPTEWSQLVASARQAKERLLAHEGPAEVPVSIQRRGKKLLGGTKTVPVSRETAEKLLIDGFVPKTTAAERAEASGRAGLTTLGLPYTSDPAIPRHISTFLHRHKRAAEEAGAQIIADLPKPDLVLVNGGVFHAPTLCERLLEVLSSWFGSTVRMLPHTSLDTAVACGAARFGLAKLGVGRVIGGGAARAYYVGVADDNEQMRALCVAPKGMEEGTETEIADRTFQLVVNQPVRFPLYAYSGDRNDKVGTLLEAADGEWTADDLNASLADGLDPLPPLESVIRQRGDLWVNPETGTVPVRLRAHLLPSGTLELSLVTVELPPRRFRLQLNLIPAAGENDVDEGAKAPDASEAADSEHNRSVMPMGELPKNFGDAKRALEKPFGNGRWATSPEAAKSLRAELEEAFGPRGQWSPTLCRALFDVLMEYEDRRGRTEVHELNWLRLLSHCARPGFGVEGDAQRIQALWALKKRGLKNPTDKSVWSEWWILWRRVAPGLGQQAQRALFVDVKPWLSGEKPPKDVPRAFGVPEMLRMTAALEKCSAKQKVEAAAWCKAHFKKLGSYWALGRLGGRAPLHGDAKDVVPPKIVAEWLEELLALDWKSADGASFAAWWMCRVTGDAKRDLSEKLRKTVKERLRGVDAPTPWLEQLSSVAQVSEGDSRRAYGESLPPGLRL